MTPTTARCGTDSGYITHRRRREQPCAACKAAHSAYEIARRALIQRLRGAGR